jgi:hypothetical protein
MFQKILLTQRTLNERFLLTYNQPLNAIKKTSVFETLNKYQCIEMTAGKNGQGFNFLFKAASMQQNRKAIFKIEKPACALVQLYLNKKRIVQRPVACDKDKRCRS